jgi:hypothetical protein
MPSPGPSVALTASIASGMPAASSAPRKRTAAIGRSGSRRNSSSRVQISLTGRPAFGQFDRLGIGIAIGIESGAEEPAEQRRMDADLFGRQAGPWPLRQEHVGRLIGKPHVQRAIGVEPRQRRRRFQLRVVEILAVRRWR